MPVDEDAATIGPEFKDPRCPFCGKADCLTIEMRGQYFQGVTSCGWMTALHSNRNTVRLMWGTRSGRKPAKLLKELAVLASVARDDTKPKGKIGDREVGGTMADARRKAELQAEADRLNPPSKEAIEEAVGVNRTGDRNEAIEEFDADGNPLPF